MSTRLALRMPSMRRHKYGLNPSIIVMPLANYSARTPVGIRLWSRSPTVLHYIKFRGEGFTRSEVLIREMWDLTHIFVDNESWRLS